MAADRTVPQAEKDRDRAVIEGKLREYFEAAPGPAYLDRRDRPGLDLGRSLRDPAAADTDGRVRGPAHRCPLHGRQAGRPRRLHPATCGEAAETAGFAWSFWNLFDGLGLMDDAHVVDPALVHAPWGLGARP